jgi:CHAT domain-containing protein
MLHGVRTVEEFRRSLARATERARATGNVEAEAHAAMLFRYDFAAPREARIEAAERALEIYRATGNVAGRAEAMFAIAELKTSMDPANRDRYRAMRAEAMALAERSGDLWQVARGLEDQSTDDWSAGRLRESVSTSLRVIDVLERIRDLQRDDLVRAWVASENSYIYYRLSGRLLRERENLADVEPTALAFAVMERLRARILLDRLDAAGATVEALPDRPENDDRTAALDAIAALQRRLLAPGLAESERSAALRELERLEAEERILRERLSRTDPRFAMLRAPELVGMDELRAALADDQALIAYQLSYAPKEKPYGVDAGGSWCLLFTRDAVHVIALPDRNVIADRVAVFLGLLERRDELDGPAAAALHRDLLSPVLDRLPASVKRLVIVPDLSLHRLPFDVLRASSSDPPLAADYETTYAPSATLWARWRGMERPAATALAVADPDLEGGAGRDRRRDALPWVEGLRQGRLPFARREAQAMIRHLGSGSRSITGSQASEHRIKALRSDEFGVLHIAAHAVVDEDHPERSAILLAPGAPEEDGLLQMREVVDLDLDGRVVVLSACRSAAGTVMTGEGAMGLARAFFQAGARTVVASLWPLRDDEAAQLVDRFYAGLAAGGTVSHALAAARKDLLADGAPPAAWAGLIVLGDGDVALREMVPESQPAPTRFGTLALLALALLVAVVASAVLLTRRS